MQSLSVHQNSFAPNVFQWQSAHYCCPTWHASGGFVTLLADKRILLRSDVRKIFSFRFITVPKCEAIRRPRRSWNQSSLRDWPFVLHSMSTICSLGVKRVFWVYGVYPSSFLKSSTFIYMFSKSRCWVVVVGCVTFFCLGSCFAYFYLVEKHCSIKFLISKLYTC